MENKSLAEFERILADPAANYNTPEDVASDTRLTREQKIIVLRQWAFDAKELQVAEEENMRGGTQPTLLHQVLVVLRRLESR